MPIAIGSKIPSVTIKRIGAEGPEDVDTVSLFAGKKVVMFAVPGAFTGTCSNFHLPSYLAKSAELRAKGIDEIYCLAVNDHWVMKAWSDAKDAAGKVTMLADGNATFTRALGLENDLTVAGMGLRAKRCSMVVDDGVVESLDIEPGKGIEVTGAEACLLRL